MSPEAITRILREGLMLVLMLSAGPMLASMLIGLVASILQATTQIQEQTLSYVPKLTGVFLIYVGKDQHLDASIQIFQCHDRPHFL